GSCGASRRGRFQLMRLMRPVFLALAIAGAFFYFTTWRSNGSHPADWLTHSVNPAKVEITEAASGEALDSEEQNNISVYRRNIPAVANVTSRAMTFTFVDGLLRKQCYGTGIP